MCMMCDIIVSTTTTAGTVTTKVLQSVSHPTDGPTDNKEEPFHLEDQGNSKSSNISGMVLMHIY